MTLSEAIVKRITELMNEKGFQQYYFFTKGVIARSTVSQVLSGARQKRIAISTINEMALTMGVSLR